MGLRVYRSSLWRILCLLLVVFGVVVPCLLLVVTVNVDSTRSNYYTDQSLHPFSTHERKPLDYPDLREASELRQQIRELEDIRSSVRDELRVFEQQRSKLSADIESHKESLARVKKELTAAKMDLQDKRGQLSKISPSLAESLRIDAPVSRCTLDLCFNLARCPLTRPFSVFVYNDANPHLFPVSSRHGNVVTDFVTDLKRTGSFTSDPTAACVFVAILENRASSGEDMPRDLQTKILSLAHWGGEGANHVLIELSTSRDTTSSLDAVSTGRAIISRSIVSPVKPFRSGFDVLLPPLPTSEVTWRDLPPLLPVSRENLIYFHGEYAPPRHPSPSSLAPADVKSLQQALDGREKIDIELRALKRSQG
ncbi:Exostosin-3 [Geodia barretti]|uniref:Exostosin-3 n=1 Tax=Geodia barretti TaxID=519541 RepID=A0AA35XIX9_GEOBA|nr:Exostosin-3 [Geodia barretti]